MIVDGRSGTAMKQSPAHGRGFEFCIGRPGLTCLSGRGLHFRPSDYELGDISFLSFATAVSVFSRNAIVLLKLPCASIRNTDAV